MLNRNISYILVGIGSFILGALYFKQKNKKEVDENKNQTLAIIKDGKYYLIFNSIVVLSREISKEQYDNFLKAYPTGKAPNNVLNNFSTPPPTYTVSNGKYYESTWSNGSYGIPIEITKEEYDFFTNKNGAQMAASDLSKG